MDNLTDQQNDGIKDDSNLGNDINQIDALLNLYESGDYLNCISKVESFIEVNPKEQGKSTLLRNIYLNCCLKHAIDMMDLKNYIIAKEMYEKILKYESELIFESDVILYKIYSQLAEIMRNTGTIEAVKQYEEKAKLIISKMVYSRAIQSIYSDFVEGKYQQVIEGSDKIDINDLDEYNRGRFYMMIGSAYYYMQEYKKGIDYLTKAIKYYKNNTYNSVLIMIYEELSKCYMHLEEYQYAYKYLKLAHKHTKLTHDMQAIKIKRVH